MCCLELLLSDLAATLDDRRCELSKTSERLPNLLAVFPNKVTLLGNTAMFLARIADDLGDFVEGFASMNAEACIDTKEAAFSGGLLKTNGQRIVTAQSP